jgi:hypothetical protein
MLFLKKKWLCKTRDLDHVRLIYRKEIIDNHKQNFFIKKSNVQ